MGWAVALADFSLNMNNLLLRSRNTAIALMGLLLPLFAACALAFMRMAEEQPVTIRTPNPAKAPIWWYGPAEYLVRLDPWFAGTAKPWFILWYVLGGLYLVSVFCVWPFLRLSPPRELLYLTLLSLVLGMIASGPCWYGLMLPFVP